jgi:hypothetical protein
MDKIGHKLKLLEVKCRLIVCCADMLSKRWQADFHWSVLLTFSREADKTTKATGVALYSIKSA